jgi:hypothetical protein
VNAWSQILVRAAFVAVALALWFWTQRLISQKPAPSGGVAIGDRVHTATTRWHGWLLVHPRAANALLIVTSGLIDVFGIYLLTTAVLGPTVRPFVAVLIVFALRQICQATCTLPSPPGMIWRDPGIPSLLVTYGTSNDFFFSGHTAISVLGALQLAHEAPAWLAVLGFIVAAAEATTVLVLRAHYWMDVFAAIFAAWAADALAQHAAPFVDVWLGRIA